MVAKYVKNACVFLSDILALLFVLYDLLVFFIHVLDL